MFQRVDDSRFVEGEHEVLRFWEEAGVFQKLLAKNAGKPKWSFLDGPITANNPMGVHHAWGRTYKDAYQRYFAMTGHELRYQNGFDCQGLWVEVEVEKELGLGTKRAIIEQGIDKFVHECKKRVLKFAARQTEQSIRLGYWMEWDDPSELRKLSQHIGQETPLTLRTPKGTVATGTAEALTAQLGNPEWGGSYFTFSTENNETIWTFLKKCFDRQKIYLGHDVMPWGGRAGSAYSQMEIADGRRLTTHKSCFVRFPLIEANEEGGTRARTRNVNGQELPEHLLVWTTTPWTLTANVACMVNPDLDYVCVKAQIKGDAEPALYYFAKENLEYKRLEKEFKEGFGRPEWQWPKEVGKLKTIAQIFKEMGGYEVVSEVKGKDLVGLQYRGPFDELKSQQRSRPQASGQAERDRRNRQWTRHPAYSESRSTAAETLQTIPQSWDGQRASSIPNYKQVMYLAIRRIAKLIDCASTSTFFFPPTRSPGPEGSFTDTGDADWNHSHAEIVSDLPFGTTTSGVEYNFYTIESLTRFFNSLQITLSRSDWETICYCCSGQDGDFSFDRERFTSAYTTIANQIFHQLDDFILDNPVNAHRVIDGGRDSKGNANVVAGEGTGIVHSAPGCGDVDHKIGMEVGLPVIAPLNEDGTYMEGFGPFTGKSAIDPATAEMVFESLREKQLLVYVETYPHIYPHCWRTGEELIFRLVDEWFINMDWRDEIKDVTKAITWLPESIQGQEREVEWLTTMRDWMISKKRFWGLALPIWVDAESKDFVVFGSIEELKAAYDERGGEGWERFEGHTPHRPWIDAVKIRNPKTGNLMTRIEDVGNPWLDAGITPFSTMNYNENYSTDALNWADWYPADLVTECFPGQFRNWFYSLLSLSTMMLHDDKERNENPEIKRPFKTLLGHRLVMDELGRPMHKSDGTAIWFEEAAEQLGVDTLRWMYLAQNPATDLRFGLRHADQPVTLQTPDGPISETKEGLPTCKVTSTPADEIRRQVLIPLWNSYAFFINYAVLDEFNPHLAQVPVSERPEIDRWILSNLQALISTCRREFEAFNSAEVCRSSAAFIDDLSNWYIRRNRRRFWRAKSEGETASETQTKSGDWDRDKLAAYQTLHEVLVTLTQLLAPCVPFLAERMYQNLVVGDETAKDVPTSVHLCDYPEVEPALLDESLNHRMAIAQRVVSMGHNLREQANQRVRQPLPELRYACANPQDAADVKALAEVIGDELNVKQITGAANLDDLVSYLYKPNLKTLGPKYGKLLGVIKNGLANLDGELLSPLRRGESVTISLEGNEVTLGPDDVMISTQQASDWAAADDEGIQIALSTTLTEELLYEGMARDLIRQVQQLRKEAKLEENARITIQWQAVEEGAANSVAAMLKTWDETIQTETRADGIVESQAVSTLSPVIVGNSKVSLAIE